MDELRSIIKKLVAANRILAAEGVVDAFGHISVRHPQRPDHYLLACSRSPKLVRSEDIMEFELDGTPVDARGRKPYLERFIHGAVYEERADVFSVVHNHSFEVIPFSVSKTPLRPLMHSCGRIGFPIPVWDMHDKFGDTNFQVENMEQGRDLVQCLGKSPVALMRGHGCVVTGPSIEEAVLTSIYLRVNARLQLDAMRLGEVIYLTPGEVEINSSANKPQVGRERAWEYLCANANLDMEAL